MDKFIIILLILIVLSLIGIYYKVLYNKIMACKVKLDESSEIINDNIKKRYDFVIRTAHLVKKNLDLELEQFKQIETLKATKPDNKTLDKKLDESYNLILQLKEDYPQLEENRGFQDIINEFSEAQDILEASKSFYDKYAVKLNEILDTFPCNIVALIHHIKKAELYNGKTNGFKNEILDNVN